MYSNGKYFHSRNYYSTKVSSLLADSQVMSWVIKAIISKFLWRREVGQFGHILLVSTTSRLSIVSELRTYSVSPSLILLRSWGFFCLTLMIYDYKSYNEIPLYKSWLDKNSSEWNNYNLIKARQDYLGLRRQGTRQQQDYPRTSSFHFHPPPIKYLGTISV